MDDEREVVEIYRKFGKRFVEIQKNDRNRCHLSEILHKLMGDIRGKKVLDAGCGAGFDAKIMAKKGGIVTGIDISPDMLRLAKKECKGLGIKFYLMDMEKTSFKSNSFDIITAIFSVSYKRRLRKVLKEFYRLLKPKGELFIVESHPIRKMVKYTGDYFETGKHWEVFKDLERFGYYRKVEDFLNTAIKIGFVLKEIKEPKPRSRENFYPHFLIMRFGK